MKIVSFSLEQGSKYYGKIDGTRFFIGRRVNYEGGKGLMNIVGTTSQRYDRNEFRDEFGFWADFIHPTAAAEGGLYHTLNTYDSAHFTFGFLQYAAHVPKGDFVTYFRELLLLPLAGEYFPDLTVEHGTISKLTDDGATPLESEDSTALLLDYLNPSVEEVEDTEVIQAARFIHWAQSDAEHRRLQVKVGIEHFKAKMKNYAKLYKLDGVDDAVCLVVADIRHQGRAKSVSIINALQRPDPLKSLLELGKPKFSERIETLQREINRLKNEGILGTHKYSIDAQDFIDK